MFWLMASAGIVAFAFAALVLFLILMDRNAREVIHQLEARTSGMNKDSVSAALQEKP